jgi:hypothetical protein
MILSEATNRALHLHKNRLIALPNVNGVVEGHKTTAGVDTGEPAVVVLVEKKKPIESNFLKRIFLRRLHPRDAVPAKIEGARRDSCIRSRGLHQAEGDCAGGGHRTP